MDNLLEGFIAAGLNPLRVGFEGKPKAGLENFILDHQFENHQLKPEFDRVINTIEDISNEIRELFQDIQRTEESGLAKTPGVYERLSMFT